MQNTQRRTFLQQAALATAGLAVEQASSLAQAQDRVQSAQAGTLVLRGDKLKLGLIGIGGMGSSHLGHLAPRKDVEIAYVCDVDQTRLAAAAKAVESASSKAPQAVKDMRTVLDDKTVDAVFIATPDHWHAPAAILALDAGKHVYVEKPCCHNIREGRLMVEAAKRTGKLLQVGTQSRSTQTVHRRRCSCVHEGEIGDVLVAKAWNSQLRGNIGKSQAERAAGAPRLRLCGSAPRRWCRIARTCCPASGAGGTTSAPATSATTACTTSTSPCWGLGVTTHPDTRRLPRRQVLLRRRPAVPRHAVRRLRIRRPASPARRSSSSSSSASGRPTCRKATRTAPPSTARKGMLIVGHATGWKLYGPKNKLIAEKTGGVDLPAHHHELLRLHPRRAEAAQRRHRGRPPVARRSCHLANIAARVGRVLHFDPQTEQITGDAEANALVRRNYRDGHWAVPKSA